MPLLSISARFDSSNRCQVQLSGGSIPAARMRLKQYAVHLAKNTSGTTSVPAYILVSLDGILGNTQIHNALPNLKDAAGNIIHDKYEINSHLHLPLTGIVTLQQVSVGVSVNKHINKQITVAVHKYDQLTAKVIDFPHTATASDSAINHLQLWFEYQSPNLF